MVCPSLKTIPAAGFSRTCSTGLGCANSKPRTGTNCETMLRTFSALQTTPLSPVTIAAAKLGEPEGKSGVGKAAEG